MKKISRVVIRVFRKCARCGKEEEPEEITRALSEPVCFDETDSRVTIEYVTDNE